jgi:hypothetical protein
MRFAFQPDQNGWLRFAGLYGSTILPLIVLFAAPALAKGG